MRKFKNLEKHENELLNETFSYLLKATDECSPDECAWVAETVFDCWLYEEGRYDEIKNSSQKEREKWDSIITNFLCDIVDLEKPIGFKLIGKSLKKRIQFRSYKEQESIVDYVVNLFGKTYEPRIAFPNHKFSLYFQDDWTIYIIYKDLEKIIPVMKLLEKNGLYALPVFSVEHLNQYVKLEKVMQEHGLYKALRRKSR